MLLTDQEHTQRSHMAQLNTTCSLLLCSLLKTRHWRSKMKCHSKSVSLEYCIYIQKWSLTTILEIKSAKEIGQAEKWPTYLKRKVTKLFLSLDAYHWYWIRKIRNSIKEKNYFKTYIRIWGRLAIFCSSLFKREEM